MLSRRTLCLALGAAVPAAWGADPVAPVVREVRQVRDPVDDPDDHVAAVAAVAAVGAALGDVLLLAEADTAVAAVARADVHLGLVEELHGL